MAAEYCAVCDQIKLTVVKGEGLFSGDRIMLEFISHGEVVQTLDTVNTLSRVGDTLTIDNIQVFTKLKGDPPIRYSIDDLFKMLADKKDDIRRTSGQSD